MANESLSQKKRLKTKKSFEIVKIEEKKLLHNIKTKKRRKYERCERRSTCWGNWHLSRRPTNLLFSTNYILCVYLCFSFHVALILLVLNLSQQNKQINKLSSSSSRLVALHAIDVRKAQRFRVEASRERVFRFSKSRLRLAHRMHSQPSDIIGKIKSNPFWLSTVFHFSADDDDDEKTASFTRLATQWSPFIAKLQL